MQVLENRSGIPISMALVYMEVAQRCKLPMVGLNMPAHFMLTPLVRSSFYPMYPEKREKREGTWKKHGLKQRRAGTWRKTRGIHRNGRGAWTGAREITRKWWGTSHICSLFNVQVFYRAH